MKHMFRVSAGLFLIAAGTFPLASCMSSPTYGTDKTAAEQLMDDLGDAVSVIPPKRDKNIAYKPRPDLVVPDEGKLALAAPQESLANRENNPNWVESPEEMRQRLRKEASENEDYVRSSSLARQEETKRKLNVDQQRQAYRENRKAQAGVSTSRRYLTDPPVEYREVSDPSVLSDLGESEKVKEKRRKKEAESAEKGSKKKQWWDPLNVF